MKKQCNPVKMAHGVFMLSVVAAVVAAVVYFTQSNILSLAGTQWILISIALGVFAANMHACKDCVKEGCCSDKKAGTCDSSEEE